MLERKNEGASKLSPITDHRNPIPVTTELGGQSQAMDEDAGLLLQRQTKSQMMDEVDIT